MKTKILFILLFLLFITNGLSAYRLGDFNEDDSVDIVDALLIAQYYVGMNPERIILDLGDVDCSDDITIIDALLVAQFYVGLVEYIDSCSPVPTPLGDTYLFTTVDGMIFVESENPIPFSMYGTQGVVTENTIPGFLGSGYLVNTEEYARIGMQLMFQIDLADSYEVRLRIYDSEKGKWTFTGYTEPAVITETPGLLQLWLNFTTMPYYVDRIVIFPKGTPESKWQDLSKLSGTRFYAVPGKKIILDMK